MPMQRRDRERIPLPRRVVPDPKHAGRGDLAVRRDRGHAGRAASTRKSLRPRRARWRSATSPEARMVRETQLRFLTRAGAEIGVASTKAFTTQLAALFLLALALAKLRGRLDAAGRAARICRRCATCPRRSARRSRSSRRSIAWAERFADEGARAVPRPRHALPDRAGRRAQAQGNLLHPRRGLSGRRAQARAAGAGRRGHAGGRGGAERRAAREAEVQHAGSARARRRAVRVRRRRHADRLAAEAST